MSKAVVYISCPRADFTHPRIFLEPCNKEYPMGSMMNRLKFFHLEKNSSMTDKPLIFLLLGVMTDL